MSKNISGLQEFLKDGNIDTESVSAYITNTFINRTSLINQAIDEAKALSSDLIQKQLDQVVIEVKLIISQIVSALESHIKKLEAEVQNEKSSLVLGFLDEDIKNNMSKEPQSDHRIMSEMNETINRYVALAENLSGKILKIRYIFCACLILAIIMYFSDIGSVFAYLSDDFTNAMGIISFSGLVLSVLSSFVPVAIGTGLKVLMDFYKKLVPIIAILAVALGFVCLICLGMQNSESVNVSIDFILGENIGESSNLIVWSEKVMIATRILCFIMAASLFSFQTAKSWRELSDCKLALSYINKVRSTYEKEGSILEMKESRSFLNQSNVAPHLEKCQSFLLNEYLSVFKDNYIRYQNSTSYGDEKIDFLEEKLSRFNEVKGKLAFHSDSDRKNE